MTPTLPPPTARKSKIQNHQVAVSLNQSWLNIVSLTAFIWLHNSCSNSWSQNKIYETKQNEEISQKLQGGLGSVVKIMRQHIL